MPLNVSNDTHGKTVMWYYSTLYIIYVLQFARRHGKSSGIDGFNSFACNADRFLTCQEVEWWTWLWKPPRNQAFVFLSSRFEFDPSHCGIKAYTFKRIFNVWKSNYQGHDSYVQCSCFILCQSLSLWYKVYPFKRISIVRKSN